MKEVVMGLVQSHLVNGQLIVNTKVKGQSQLMVNTNSPPIELSPIYVHLIQYEELGPKGVQIYVLDEGAAWSMCWAYL